MSTVSNEPTVPKRPSYLWPLLAWVFVGAQVYYDLPRHQAIVNTLGVSLPDFSRQVLENAHWIVPMLGLATLLLAWVLRAPVLRWLVLMVVPTLCIFGLLFIRVQAMNLYMNANVR